LRAKDVTPLSMYRGSQQDIRLLSEANGGSGGGQVVLRAGQECLFLGGLTQESSISALQLRLAAMGVKVQASQKDLSEPGYWLRIAPESQRLLGDVQLQNLSK